MNRALWDMGRTMLISSGLPKSFWAESIYTTCYLLNKYMVRSLLEKTPYELLKGRRANVSYLRAFGCKFYVHNNGKEALEKIDARSNKGVFLS